MQKWHIFFIMWISWAWKWTLIDNLKKYQNELSIKFLRSYVTRPIRKGEVEWNIYHFISLEEFKKWIENNEFLEYELNHGLHYYWTKKIDVLDNGINIWKNVLKEIEVKWLNNIFKNNSFLKENIVSIFLDISEEMLEERIKARWAEMSQEELNNRKKSLKNEKIESRKICDYIIDTSNLSKEQTLEEVLQIIEKTVK